MEVVDENSSSTVDGGVNDVYGEDTATQELWVTPWTASVAR